MGEHWEESAKTECDAWAIAARNDLPSQDTEAVLE